MDQEPPNFDGNQALTLYISFPFKKNISFTILYEISYHPIGCFFKEQTG